jgi:uncharacterized protein (DUF433 family)
MDVKNYISTDPAVCAGQPHIAGTRISVEIIQDHVSAGYTVEQIQHVYPHLSTEQICAAIEYARTDARTNHVTFAG